MVVMKKYPPLAHLVTLILRDGLKDSTLILRTTRDKLAAELAKLDAQIEFAARPKAAQVEAPEPTPEP